MNLEKSLTRIIELFLIFQREVEARNRIDLFDINRLAEDVLVPVFKDIFDCQFLRNLNRQQRNFPGLDLADDNARIAFQVSSTSGIEKVKNTLEKVVRNQLYLRYDAIYIYILTEKQKRYDKKAIREIVGGRFDFDPARHIIDARDLIARIRELEYANIERVEQTLEVHLTNARKFFAPASAAKTEHLTLNLLPIAFPSDLYISKLNYSRNEMIEKARESGFFVSRRVSERGLVWAALNMKGLRFSSDWVTRSGEIITFRNLRDETLPLASLIEPSAADPIPVARYLRDESGDARLDRLNILRELLRTTLQAQLSHRGITWQHDEQVFFFVGGENQKERKEEWSRGRRGGRLVYQQYPYEHDPHRIKFHEHLAFEVNFDVYDGQWHMAIKPTWFCSSNGYKKSRWHDWRVSFRKREASNDLVYDLLLFVHELLRKEQERALLNEAMRPLITLGDLVTLGGMSPINDADWLQHDEKKKRKALNTKDALPLFGEL